MRIGSSFVWRRLLAIRLGLVLSGPNIAERLVLYPYLGDVCLDEMSASNDTLLDWRAQHLANQWRRLHLFHFRLCARQIKGRAQFGK